jgi:hypothetical protein
MFRTLGVGDEREWMRRAAAILATLVAISQLALFAIAQRQLQAALTVVPTPEVDWLRWVWAVAWAAPWGIAAILFAVGATRRAVAVAVVSAVLVATTGLGSLPAIADAPPGTDATLWVTQYGGALVWFLAVAAGVMSWLARPRGSWRLHAPGPVGWYVTVAVLAWLPAAFRTTQFAPPGTPRPFVETVSSQLDGFDLAASLAGAVVLGVLLFVAPRLRPDVGGTVLLAYALPTLLADLGGVVQVATQDLVIFTPSGVLGLAGDLGLAVAGAVWASRQVTSTPVDTEPGAAEG